MYALDFEYDKQNLSDFGFIICNFNDDQGATYADIGSNVTFITTPAYRGIKNYKTATKYDECLQATIHICKNPDETNDMVISRDEYRDLARWLCREEFLPFRVLYADDFECETCHFDASFSMRKIEVGEILYGLELTIKTNSPFGYGLEHHDHLIFNEENLKKKIIDRSDVIGQIYPNMTITCMAEGDLIIRNERYNDENPLEIKECINGEIITIEHKQIRSSLREGHNLANNVNYRYIKIGNTYRERDNVISVNMPCIVDIRYNPTIYATL